MVNRSPPPLRRSPRLEAARRKAEIGQTSKEDRVTRQSSPFLELPPELRNRIYEQALYHDRLEGYTANAALLRTCKQIHAEAQGILYNLATFGVAITAKKWTVYRNNMIFGEESTVTISGDVQHVLKNFRHRNQYRFDAFMRLWPATVQKLLNIKLFLEVEGTSFSEPSATDTHWLLYGLVACLRRVSKAARIQITLGREMHAARDWFQQELLYPVAKLPSHISLDLTNSPSHLVEYITGMRKVEVVQFDAYAELAQLPACPKIEVTDTISARDLLDFNPLLNTLRRGPTRSCAGRHGPRADHFLMLAVVVLKEFSELQGPDARNAGFMGIVKKYESRMASIPGMVWRYGRWYPEP